MSEKPKRKISLYNKSAASFSNKKFKLVTKTVRSNSPVGNYADKIAERTAERVAVSKETLNNEKNVSEKNLTSDTNDNLKSRRKKANQLKKMMIETDNISNVGYRYNDYEDVNNHSNKPKTNENVDIINDQHNSEKEKKNQSRFWSSNAKKHDEKNANPELLKKRAAIAQAYKQAILKKQMQRSQSAVEIHYQQQVNSALMKNMRAKESAEFTAKADKFCRDNIIGGAEELGGFVDAMSSGSAEKIITQPVESVIRKNLSNGTNQLIDSITTVTGAVAGADSIGNAASNVGITLAAQEIKKAAKNIFLTPSDKRIEDRLQKKFRYIDRKTENRLKKIEKEKKEALNGNINSKTEKELQKIERSKEQYKEKLAKQQRDIQRKTAQKSIYIKHNRNNPAFTGSKAARAQKKLLKKKKKGFLLSGAAMGSFLAFMMIIVIILVLIMSLLQPIGFTKRRADVTDDEALAESDDVEKMCMEFLKYKFDIQQTIDKYNYQMKKSYINQWEYVYDPYGHIIKINPKEQFFIVKKRFWEVDSKTQKHTLTMPQMSYHCGNFEKITKIDAVSGVITEKDFDFTDFILYAQAASVKKRYPDDDIEKHADTFFEVNEVWLQIFFNDLINYSKELYTTYCWYNLSPSSGYKEENDSVGFKGDEIMEKSVNAYLRENGWNLYCRGEECSGFYCHGHPVTAYLLEMKTYADVLNDFEIDFSAADTAYIEDLRERLKVLNKEIIPSISETYSGTYFETEETEELTVPSYIDSNMTTTEPVTEITSQRTGRY